MILFKRAGDLAGWLERQRTTGQSIGFVPTLGALHPGHISLIDISKRTTRLTVCSIFINPTQFNDPRDFQKYPVTIEKDICLLEKAGTDALFLPDAEEVYPGGTKNLEKYDLGALETILEGKYRPGHFQGVCQVMRRLLDLVRPDHLFMGQKDYQQCMVVRRLLELMGAGTELHACPIVREADGLAMSSRNLRLTEAQRAEAPAIYWALSGLKEGGTVEAAKKRLETAGFRIDYVEIADAETLMPAAEEGNGVILASGEVDRVALVAAFLGEIRLIDNMIL
jgi:pantoate--beta-alanine ligase